METTETTAGHLKLGNMEFDVLLFKKIGTTLDESRNFVVEFITDEATRRLLLTLRDSRYPLNVTLTRNGADENYIGYLGAVWYTDGNKIIARIAHSGEINQ